jgi:basic membrane protein A
MTGLAGCLGGGGGDGGDGGDATPTEGESETTTSGDGGDGGDGGGETNIGMVYALGGLGDKSFNDMAHQGIQQAESEFEVAYKNAEPSGPSDFKTQQQNFATASNPDYELICCIGFAQTSALQETSKQFSDQRFMIVDSVVEGDNVASYVFKEHQGSFQVGYLAGLLTEMDFSAGAGSTNDDTVVGFVGGKEVPLIKKFEAGYKAGVKHANPDIEVRAAYAGDWSDPAKGKEIALSMYGEGADIVYHAAGGTGVGVFRAAQEEGRYAIGVDSDQSRSAPEYKDVILASMVKHVDTAVYNSVSNIVNDEYNGGEVTALGLQSDGVEAVLGQQLGESIPEDVKTKLDESRQQVSGGEITVPEKPENV